MRALLILCMLLCSAAVSAQPANWHLYITDGLTQVEYRYSEAELLQVRAQTEVSTTPEAFMHLLYDTENITTWAANTERAEILSQPDTNVHVVHTYFSAIWPVSKRDMVTQSVWSQDKVTGVVTLKISDLGQRFPAVEGYVRMQQVQGEWILTPSSEGRLHIQYIGQADPAGKLPQFITDKVALKATYTTFKQLFQVLTQS